MKELKEFVKNKAKLFGLDREWEIDLIRDNERCKQEKTDALVEWSIHKRKATIVIDDTIQNDDYGREVIIHELLHVRLAFITYLAYNLTTKGSERKLLEAIMEQTVNSMASALCENL